MKKNSLAPSDKIIIYPDYKIIEHKNNIIIKTYIRKQHNNKYYLIPIARTANKISLAFLMRTFIEDCYMVQHIYKIIENDPFISTDINTQPEPERLLQQFEIAGKYL